MAGAVTTLSDSTFDETVASDGAPVLVDFWAEWCGPCKMIAPILEEIADEQGEALQVAKLNVDEAGDVARRFEVMSIPTLILFKDGEPVKRIVGANPSRPSSTTSPSSSDPDSGFPLGTPSSIHLPEQPARRVGCSDFTLPVGCTEGR